MKFHNINGRIILDDDKIIMSKLNEEHDYTEKDIKETKGSLNKDNIQNFLLLFIKQENIPSIRLCLHQGDGDVKSFYKKEKIECKQLGEEINKYSVIPDAYVFPFHGEIYINQEILCYSVLIHELTHFFVLGHGNEFYRTLERLKRKYPKSLLEGGLR